MAGYLILRNQPLTKMVSESATTAIGGLISALFSPGIPNQPIACRAPSRGGGRIAHSSASSKGRSFAHLVIRAGLVNGEPWIAGRLFEGDPYVVAGQAEDWYDAAFESANGTASAETAMSAITGFIAALFQDQSPKPLLMRIDERGVHIRVVMENDDERYLILCASNEDGFPALSGALFEGTSDAVLQNAEQWASSYYMPSTSAVALGGKNWFLWSPPSPSDIAFSWNELTNLGSYLNALENIEAYFIEHGFRKVVSSRLGRYRKALLAFKAKRTDKTMGDAFNAAYEVRQLIPIFHYLADTLSRQQLSKLITGGYSQNDEKNSPNTPGRNHQFELYIAAICRRAGFQISVDVTDSVATPDILVESPAYRIVVEAKRIKTEAAVYDRLRHANHQIRASGRDGVIVMDITPILNPDFKFLRVFSTHRAHEILSEAIHNFIHTQNRIMRRLAVAQTCAYVVFASFPVVWVGHEFGTITEVVGFGLYEEDDPRVPFIRDFVERFTGALI